MGADGFADAYFPGPFLRTRRTEVHKVDAGDHQHQYAHDREKTNVVDEASRVVPSIEVAVKTPFFHRMQKELRFLFIVGLLLHEVLDLTCKRIHGNTLFQLYKVLKEVILPLRL